MRTAARSLTANFHISNRNEKRLRTSLPSVYHKPTKLNAHERNEGQEGSTRITTTKHTNISSNLKVTSQKTANRNTQEVGKTFAHRPASKLKIASGRYIKRNIYHAKYNDEITKQKKNYWHLSKKYITIKKYISNNTQEFSSKLF